MTDPLKDLKQAWARLEAPPRGRIGAENRPTTPDVVRELRRAWRALEAPPRRIRPAGQPRPWLRAAAVIAFLVLGAWPWLAPDGPEAKPRAPANRAVRETAKKAEDAPPRMHRARLTETGIELNSGPVRLIYVTSRMDS